MCAWGRYYTAKIGWGALSLIVCSLHVQAFQTHAIIAAQFSLHLHVRTEFHI